MATPRRFFGYDLAAMPQESNIFNSKLAVNLAVFLCSLIGAIVVLVVVRWAWLRRTARRADSSPPNIPVNKGLKQSYLRSLPKLTFNGEVNGKLDDCAICLAEFENGEEIRVLPQCEHGFHVGCIDKWLGSHASCPSCRQIIVVPTCVEIDLEVGLRARAADDNRFLP